MKRDGRVLYVIDQLNLENLCALNDIAVKRREGVLAALDSRTDEATVTLHREFPICPYRATSVDSVRDVKEGVNRDWACRKTRGVVLIVQPVRHLD